jgi:HD-like signal output (HDOD) protein
VGDPADKRTEQRWANPRDFLIQSLGCPVENLPTLPLLAMELLRLAADENCTVEEVVRVIGRDPVLAARLLRIANSPLFSRNGEITSLSRAILKVGLNEIRNLALGLIVFDAAAPARGARHTYHHDRLWSHSIIVGLLAEVLAQEEFNLGPGHYVFGLIHDLGKVALEAYLTTEFRLVLGEMESQGRPWAEAERKNLGFDHALLGQALLEYWGLPPVMTAVVGYHHQPWMATRFQDQAGVVFLANLFAKMLGYYSFAPEAKVSLRHILTMRAISFLTQRGWVFEGRLLERLRQKLQSMLGQFDHLAL